MRQILLTISLVTIFALTSCKGQDDGEASRSNENSATADASACTCKGSANGPIERRGKKESLKLFCAGAMESGRGPVRMRDRSYNLEASFRNRLEPTTTGDLNTEIKLSTLDDGSVYSSSNCTFSIEENIPLQQSLTCTSTTMIRLRGKLHCKVPKLRANNNDGTEIMVPDGIDLEFSFEGVTL